MNECKSISLLRGVIPTALVVCGFTPVLAQDFVLETSTLHPIFGETTSGHYTGCAWVDYDGDDDLDLFVINPSANDLYRNDGAGVFTPITTGILVTDGAVAARGTSWADYDNDGDLDCFISGIPSRLYQNDGSGNFTKVVTGEIFTEDNRGWSSGWVDYDNDGFLDLVISHPGGFVGGGPPTPNHLYHNDGPPNYSFTKVDTGAVTQGVAAYTHGSWYDYDEDGDMDLFMASGPASSSPRPDYIYVNQLTETGVAGFLRLTDTKLATDSMDGQTWSIMDYDLDGDLDAFISNWGQNSGLARRNRLYRNDGGVYTEILGEPLATDLDVSLSNVWGDFDNDGDEDCFVANDGSYPSRYYINNGDGSFTRVDTGFIAGNNNPNSGATVGDYDDDGDLDLFVAGAGPGNRLLFYNELSSANHWLKVRPQGVYSNRSAIGAVARVKATIGGSPVWLRRQVSASNSFMGHNMLDLHFGLGDAA
ncbi:MAG TPA: CRTAC1 family protein, partial [candidate division Zixibacteria bacterium]|nr:CRTAC1 family protein [candidate division Zixibacteria bacterium]